MTEITVVALAGIPEVRHGDVLADLIAAAAPDLRDGDVVVVTKAVVAAAEGRVVRAETSILEREAARVLRRSEGVVIAETHHGFVCEDAGVDESDGMATLLPVDPDRSARRIRDGLRGRTGASVGVIIADRFGRPWRAGVTAVAVGCAGVAGVVASGVCTADELAAAGALAGGPVAVVRGADPGWLREGSVVDEVVRQRADDLFR